MNEGCSESRALMGTLVTLRSLTRDDDAFERAWQWFRDVESCCSRFDGASELQRLCAQPGVVVPVSAMLFEAVSMACAVAEDSEGAFDPTIGHVMVERGFDRHYATGIRTRSSGTSGSYHDIHCDAAARTIVLARPLQLDLGAVAKGLAIDLARKALHHLGDFVIEAGGDVYASGRNAHGHPWRVGIRHPLHPDTLIDVIDVSDMAVCTSGLYERGPHLLDARTQLPGDLLISVTVMAPSAMVADAMSTAAFVLGPVEGRALLERHGLDGLLVTPDLNCISVVGSSVG